MGERVVKFERGRERSKMGDFLNVTSQARASMYLPYRKQVKMPEVKAQEVRRNNGGKQETEYF